MKKDNSRSQFGWIISDLAGTFSPMYGPSISNRKSLYAETLASITPREFVKRDKERKLKEMETLKCPPESLTKLYNDVMKKNLSESTMNTQLELAKEQTYCVKDTPPPPVFTLPAEGTTQSLLDIIERIVRSYTTNSISRINGNLRARNKSVTQELVLNSTIDSLNISNSSRKAGEKQDEKFKNQI